MHRQIWKFEVPLVEYPVIAMPRGARVVHFGEQKDKPQVWALVDRQAATEPRKFRLIGTGQDTILDMLNEHVGYVGADSVAGRNCAGSGTHYHPPVRRSNHGPLTRFDDMG
mgnify:CR=1 FL=1